jgi:hypothetical protein
VAGPSKSGNSHRRGRSRKRRPSAQAASASAPARVARAEPAPTGGAKAKPASAGERPQAPWHPLPLSELLILIGAIGTVVGIARLGNGAAQDAPLLFAGLAAVMIGTIEVTLREHRSGYRSHMLLLALLPTILFHTATILIVSAFTPAPRALNVGLLIVDAAIFAVLFKLLRASFTDARRERTFATRR